MVLSDVGTGAARRTGALHLILVGWSKHDRDPSGAMRPEELYLGRKTLSPADIFGAAKLFTAGCGERGAGALLAGGGTTLETVSGAGALLAGGGTTLETVSVKTSSKRQGILRFSTIAKKS